MIIGEVERIEDDEIHVKVDYTMDEAKILNEKLNCLTDMGSWITFVVKANSVDNYTDCEIKEISMYTTIESKEYTIPAHWFSDDLINAVLDVADNEFSDFLIRSERKPKDVGKFMYDGDYSGPDVKDFPTPYKAKNSDLYFGCTKYNS